MELVKYEVRQLSIGSALDNANASSSGAADGLAWDGAAVGELGNEDCEAETVEEGVMPAEDPQPAAASVTAAAMAPPTRRVRSSVIR